MQALPYYLAIGMPYELFWDGDPNLVKAYREAHELRMELKNQEMWAQGKYELRAFKHALDLFAIGLNGGKGKANEYPNEPIPFTAREQKVAKERNKERTLKWVEQNQH